ncbi:unnamed protein product, partial [Laminaria digitata]
GSGGGGNGGCGAAGARHVRAVATAATTRRANPISWTLAHAAAATAASAAASAAAAAAATTAAAAPGDVPSRGARAGRHAAWNVAFHGHADGVPPPVRDVPAVPAVFVCGVSRAVPDSAGHQPLRGHVRWYEPLWESGDVWP